MGADSTRALIFVSYSKAISGRASVEEQAERTSLINGRPPPAALINGLCGRPPYMDTNEALFLAKLVSSCVVGLSRSPSWFLQFKEIECIRMPGNQIHNKRNLLPITTLVSFSEQSDGVAKPGNDTIAIAVPASDVYFRYMDVRNDHADTTNALCYLCPWL